VILGVGMIKALEAHLEHAKTLPICEQASSFRWLWAAVWIGLVALCISAAWLAQRSLRLNQWPLPGAWVFRRTPVRRGNSAKWRALVLLGWSLAVLVGSTWSWYAGDNYVAGIESQRCVER